MTSLGTYQQNNPIPQDAQSQPGFLQKYVTGPISNAFSSGMNQVGQAFSTPPSHNPLMAPIDNIEGALKMGSGLVTAATAPLAPVLNPTIGAASNALNSAVSNSSLTDNPSYQQFAGSPAGQVTARVAGDVSNAANLAGGVVGAEGIGSKLFTDNPVFKPSGYQAGIDTATAANDVAGQQAVKAANDMSGTMTDVKTGLGNQFAEAPKTIEASDPNARLVLSSDSVDALNKLKNTASFQLPETLRLGGKQGVGYTPGSLSDIQNLYNLTPSDTQDLLTRLNELTFKSRASGDLAVNQQTVDLTNALKRQAQDSFGHVTDAQGNSVWNRAYQDYTQGTQALNAMGDIAHIPKSTGEMPSPLDINKSMTKILDLQKTPQGRAVLQQTIQDFKNVTGYDLTDSVAAVGKLLETQKALDVATKGSHTHQLGEALKSPRLEARHLWQMAAALGGIGLMTSGVGKKVFQTITGQ